MSHKIKATTRGFPVTYITCLLSAIAAGGPSRAAANCVDTGVCSSPIEIVDDGLDNDGDGIELHQVIEDSAFDSDFEANNELTSFSIGWTETQLAFGFDFTLEVNALVWYLELDVEGGEDDFLGLAAGGTYAGAYPSDVEFDRGIDLMAATYGLYPLTLHRVSDDASQDITDTADASCLTYNCSDGTASFGFVRIAWNELYGLGEGMVPPGAVIRIAGIIRARENEPPADIAPDNPGEVIVTYATVPVDTDEDGVPDQAYFSDGDGDGYSPQTGDCDDEDSSRNPGADEICDGVDNDCDGRLTYQESDADGDGYLACAVGMDSGDCDDTDATRNPGAEEVCDGLDNDCDADLPEGGIDEGFDQDERGGADCLDDDGDGYSEQQGDCDDEAADLYPGAAESCDGRDENCDGQTDEGFDQDGLGGPDCDDNDGDGYSEDENDCDDASATISPDAAEVCDGLDNNCDGQVDEGFDLDGIGGADCTDDDGDGLSEQAGDCNDEDIAQSPQKPERCDGLDNNCDGRVDEGFDDDGIGGSDCIDNDWDGFSEDEGDCVDADPSRYPGALEICDGLDNDCDGVADEGFDADGVGGVDCLDQDGDGVSEEDGDCDDADASRFPGADELCDAIDNNCDGNVDEGFDLDGIGGSDCIDNDWDGLSEWEGDCNDAAPLISPRAEEEPGNDVDENCDGSVSDRDGDGFETDEGDCDDKNADVYPGAEDVCDGVDNDCDADLPGGGIDEGLPEVCGDGVDNDCDGVIDEGEPEVCDGVDNDCDGRIDNGVRTVGADETCVHEPGFTCTMQPVGARGPRGWGWTVVFLGAVWRIRRRKHGERRTRNIKR